MTIKQYDTIHDGLKTLDKHMEAQNAHIAQLEAELAEARKDSERLEWAWVNPGKFAEAQRSTPPNRTGRQQMDAARGAK